MIRFGKSPVTRSAPAGSQFRCEMPKCRRAGGSRRAARGCVGILCVVLVACGDDDRIVGPAPDRPTFPGIVSNATSLGSGQDAAAAAGPSVAFVSLPPGTFPHGEVATITNHRVAAVVTTQIVAGGFDPVAIAAAEGDTLAVDIQLLNDSITANTVITVPPRKRPTIVRTDPPPKKRDVPLNASVVVVFSEPVDPGTVSQTSIRLERAGVPVSGTVQLAEGSPWIAVVRPASELLPGAGYDLIVTPQVRDLDGDELEAGTQQSFITASLPPFGGRLAFHTWDGVSSEERIVTMNPDGSGIAYLGSGLDPSWSPDGTKIAFWRHDNPQGGIYIMNANGSSVRAVAPHGYQPTWSPDGSRLAFGCGGICVVNTDGSDLDTLTAPVLRTNPVDMCVLESDPAWSPDGSAIAFTRWLAPEEGGSPCTSLMALRMFPFDFWGKVWLMNVDGTNAREIPATVDLPLTSALWPAWSPDGSRLAFLHVTPDMERISIVHADGTNLRTVVQKVLPPWNQMFGAPDWSPDGKWIVHGSAVAWFFVDTAGEGDIRIVTPPTVQFRNTIYILWSWSRL